MSRLLLIVAGVAVLAGLLAIPIARRHMHAETGMTNRHGVRATLAAVGALLMGMDAATAQAVPPTTIGVSLTAPSYFRRARSQANLAAGSNWYAADHHTIGRDEVDKDGNVKRLASGPLSRVLTLPNADRSRVTIRCSWKGKGELMPTGKMQGVGRGANSFTFGMVNGRPDEPRTIVQLKLSSIDATDPIRDIDCRETDMPADARFDPRYVASLRGFKIIRFMDWQHSNFNAPVTWATRHLPNSIDTAKDDGVSIEDMIALTKELGADPWFNMPWNGDDDYYERFARMVHDALPPDRTVYVELANEVWNHRFKASQQATQEGMTAGLAPDPYHAGLVRYAQKLSHVMDIWAKVFADRPHKLVRVAGCQVGGVCAKIVLGFEDTPKHIDALATAPYFGIRLNKEPPATVDAVFAALSGEMDRAIDLALRSKAVAAQYDKRYMAYEAGQHLIFKDLDFYQKVERDPRMYDMYKAYIEAWRSKIGDVLMLFNQSQEIGRYGAFGLTEYLGQPLADAPKMRAAQDEIATLQGGKPSH